MREILIKPCGKSLARNSLPGKAACPSRLRRNVAAGDELLVVKVSHTHLRIIALGPVFSADQIQALKTVIFNTDCERVLLELAQNGAWLHAIYPAASALSIISAMSADTQQLAEGTELFQHLNEVDDIHYECLPDLG